MTTPTLEGTRLAAVASARCSLVLMAVRGELELHRWRWRPSGRTTTERRRFATEADLRAWLGDGVLSRALYAKAGWRL